MEWWVVGYLVMVMCVGLGVGYDYQMLFVGQVWYVQWQYLFDCLVGWQLGDFVMWVYVFYGQQLVVGVQQMVVDIDDVGQSVYCVGGQCVIGIGFGQGFGV